MKNIWEDQFEFNKKFFEDMGLDVTKLSSDDKIKWSKEFILHIGQELHDLINCFPNWKMHYRNKEMDDHFIKSNIKEEYIDAFKYFMGLGQVLGINFSSVEDVYKAKTEVVKQKYEQNRQILELKNHEVIVFDIDGVINTYPECTLEWMNKKYGMSYSSIEELKSSIGIEKYEEYKEAYRLSGDKRFQPVNQDTVDSINKLKLKGYKIVLYTVRPVSKYKRIYHDTLYWLNNSGIKFDAIYWSDYSKEDFYKLGLKIKFVVDDTLANAKLFAKEGFKVYLLDKYYNRDVDDSLYSYERINKVSDIIRSV